MLESAAKSEEPPRVDFTDVNRHNFNAVMPIMRTAIQEATFIAIDTEFTGLFPEGVMEDVLDDYEGRYKRLLASADNFIICQFGLAAFRWHAAPAPGRGGFWEARTFNAYIFPRPDDSTGWDKRFLCQSSSLSYLAEQGFDFNKMIRDGIGYIPLRVRDAQVRRLREEADKQQRTMQLRSEGEEALVEGLRGRVLMWLLGSEQELQVPLAPTKRQRNLLRLLVQEEFQLPSLGYDPFSIEEVYTKGGRSAGSGGGAAAAGASGGVGQLELEGEESASDGEGDGSVSGAGAPAVAVEGYVRLRRLDHWRPGALIANGQQLTARQRIEMLVEQSGFSQVLEALRDAGRPVVGHNAAFDLSYTLAQFTGTLPRSWAEYKTLARRTFPGGVYDTKHVAQQLAAHQGLPLGDTSLGSLHRTLMDEQWLRANVPAAAGGSSMPDIRHAPGFMGYDGVEDKAHEAGFDAFMTGSAFARLLRIAGAKAAGRAGSTGEGGASASGAAAAAEAAAAASAPVASAAAAAEADALLQPLLPYRGRLNMMRSDLPYYDVFGSDPVPSRPAMLHVSGFTPNTRYSYLLQRFVAAGLGPVQVSMQMGPGGAVGALVQLAKADMVARALQTARKKWGSWTVVTYAEYANSRQQQVLAQQQGGAAAGLGYSAGVAARTPPRFIWPMVRPAEGGAQGQEGGQQEGGQQDGGQQEAGQQEEGQQQEAEPRQEASGTVTAADLERKQRKQQQKGATAIRTERQRLQAFTQQVAVATTTMEKFIAQNQSRGELSAALEGGARGIGEGEGSTPADAAPSASAVVDEAASARSDQSMSGGEDVAAVAAGVKGDAAEEAEVARVAAERLRNLAMAAQRLNGWSDKANKGGGSSDGGGGGMALQRPGRPVRR